MMQAFNKKLDDLQKDLEKVKRNQVGTQRNIRISDIKKDTECFKCGQTGHWKRECNEQQRRRPQTEETPVKSAARHLCTRRKHKRIHQRAYFRVNTSNKEAGMYIDLKKNDVPANFLVDTGVTISLVSNKIFSALDNSKRPEIRQIRKTIVTDNGTNLSSIEQSLFNLKMGNQQCGIEVVIADLAIDGILGLDFFQRYNCLIDLRGMCYASLMKNCLYILRVKSDVHRKEQR
jgi:predicted aspartyl protease